ncbi:MAG: hypothetical protein ACPG5T_01685 [Endozoicomonas sp.]
MDLRAVEAKHLAKRAESEQVALLSRKIKQNAKKGKRFLFWRKDFGELEKETIESAESVGYTVTPQTTEDITHKFEW